MGRGGEPITAEYFSVEPDMIVPHWQAYQVVALPPPLTGVFGKRLMPRSVAEAYIEMALEIGAQDFANDLIALLDTADGDAEAEAADWDEYDFVAAPSASNAHAIDQTRPIGPDNPLLFVDPRDYVPQVDWRTGCP